jgi:transcriptional regulator with XRE-family HTH domain
MSKHKTVGTSGMGASMKSTLESESFGERLKQALVKAHYAPDRPSALAREFNLRFPGKPITVHAARKWLQGGAIPTQEKVRALAEWLHVPVDWLRFGGKEAQAAENARGASQRFDDEYMKIVSDMHRLDDASRSLAREFIRMLVLLNFKKRS